MKEYIFNYTKLARWHHMGAPIIGVWVLVISFIYTDSRLPLLFFMFKFAVILAAIYIAWIHSVSVIRVVIDLNGIAHFYGSYWRRDVAIADIQEVCDVDSISAMFAPNVEQPVHILYRGGRIYIPYRMENPKGLLAALIKHNPNIVVRSSRWTAVKGE